jgi:hypothetical protein
LAQGISEWMKELGAELTQIIMSPALHHSQTYYAEIHLHRCFMGHPGKHSKPLLTIKIF